MLVRTAYWSAYAGKKRLLGCYRHTTIMVVRLGYWSVINTPILMLVRRGFWGVIDTPLLWW